jgi:pSer/pThr/pTyr-binding forkhead associated (FHA) protein
MNARLFCKTGQLAGAEYEITSEATIGKGTENTIQLYPTIISGEHARIFFDTKKNCYFLEDLRSRNGTKLDGVRVTGKERLDRLNVITFAGKFDFVFQVMDEKESKPKSKAPPTPVHKTVLSDDFAPIPVMQVKPEPAKGAKTMIDDGAFSSLPKIENKRVEEKPQPPIDKNKTVFGDDFTPMPMIPGVDSRQDRQAKAPIIPAEEQGSAASTIFVLEFKNIKASPPSFTLKEGENTVGREAGCEIRIEDGSLSRKHAVLTVKEGNVKLKDLGSKNHTFVGDRKITSEIEIQPGVVLMFGVVIATLRRK